MYLPTGKRNPKLKVGDIVVQKKNIVGVASILKDKEFKVVRTFRESDTFLVDLEINGNRMNGWYQDRFKLYSPNWKKRMEAIKWAIL